MKDGVGHSGGGEPSLINNLEFKVEWEFNIAVKYAIIFSFLT
jgi:hypothetical protein